MYCPNPDCPNIDATGDPAEFREGTLQCDDCGSFLVAGEPPASLSEEAQAERRGPMVTVATYETPEAAHAGRGLLASNGIDAYVGDDMMVGLLQPLSEVVGGVKLTVAEENAEQATEILKSFFPETPAGDLAEPAEEE